MKNRQRFLVALTAFLSFTATASVSAVSVVSAADEDPPVLSDADPCRGVYGLRDTRVDTSGAEQVFVESSAVRNGDTGFTSFSVSHDQYFVNRGGCYDTFGIYVRSGSPRPAIANPSAWRTVNVGGTSYDWAPSHYDLHTIRLPLVWPTKAAVANGNASTIGGLLLNSPYELDCRYMSRAACHVRLPCSYSSASPGLGSDGMYDYATIYPGEQILSGGARGCATSLGGNYTLNSRQICSRFDIVSAVVRSGNSAAYFSSPAWPSVDGTYPRCIARQSFAGATASHRTMASYVVGEWKYCTELTAAAAAAAGCDMEARGNPGGDPGGNPGGPGDPPGSDDSDPEAPVDRPGECVANCSSVSDPGTDPAEWSQPYVPPIYDTQCRNYTDAEATAYADARADRNLQPDLWNWLYNARLNQTTCWQVLRPQPYTPSWPSGWETYPSMDGYFLLEHLKTHASTGDSQHWGVTDITCATAEENCANHPAIRIMCAEAYCGLNTSRSITGTAGTCTSWWQYRLDDYLVNQFQMWSKWVDGRANPYFPERYESFVWHPEWDGSDPTSRWNRFDSAASQRFAAAGITFENATTGGQGTSQRLDFVGSLWIRGVVDWQGCDGYGRAYEGEEEFVVEVPLEYFFGGWDRDSSNNHWTEGPNDWQGSGRDRQRYNSADGITIGGVKKPSIYD